MTADVRAALRTLDQQFDAVRGIGRVAPGHGEALGFEQRADRFEGGFGGNARGSPGRIFGRVDPRDECFWNRFRFNFRWF